MGREALAEGDRGALADDSRAAFQRQQLDIGRLRRVGRPGDPPKRRRCSRSPGGTSRGRSPHPKKDTRRPGEIRPDPRFTANTRARSRHRVLVRDALRSTRAQPRDRPARGLSDRVPPEAEGCAYKRARRTLPGPGQQAVTSERTAHGAMQFRTSCSGPARHRHRARQQRRSGDRASADRRSHPPGLDISLLAAPSCCARVPAAAYVESIGPGRRHRSVRRSPSRSTAAHLQRRILGGRTPADNPAPPNSGVYKVASVLTHRNFGNTTDIVGVVEGPVLRIGGSGRAAVRPQGDDGGAGARPAITLRPPPVTEARTAPRRRSIRGAGRRVPRPRM